MKKIEEVAAAIDKCLSGDGCYGCKYDGKPYDDCRKLLSEELSDALRNMKQIKDVYDVYGGEEGILSMDSENERLKDENRALRTELQVNGKKRDTLCIANDNGTDQTAKQDNGKLDPTLVPTDIIWAIAAVRREGVKKYKDPLNYRRVEKERLRAAAFRHFLKYLKDPDKPDEETGLPHLWHCVTNLAFLCEMEGYEYGENTR